jgi:alkanesulfonate monooxygenase SsuD/methylene tetrahydromethanopterin reductase-like flavin-dependent oxidoreductase (luciferase family)
MPKPKVIVQIYPMLPTADRAEREQRRPLGRDRDLYHDVLHDWLDIVKAADDLGVWGISTIEHHLHSEGYEVGPNPGVLNAWWASHVKQARVGSLGYVMATVAAVATDMGKKDDVRNREIFEERMEMLIKCWTEDSIELDGQFYQAPYPLDQGIDYPAWRGARDAGAIGEIGDDGRVRKVSVVPKPYQDPYPPVFQAVSASPDSIRFAARNGFRPTYFTRLEKMEEFCALYVEEGRKAGHEFVLGERQNMCRWIHVADTEKEYDQKLEAYDRDIYENFYVPFFPQFPDDTSSIDWVQNIKDSGIFHGGTLEQLTEQFVDAYSKVPAEFITLIWHYAQVPKDEVISELEVFMTKVLPELEVPELTGAAVPVGGVA